MAKKSNSDYSEAVVFKILRPQLARKGCRFDTWISSRSPSWQIDAAIQLTRYLCLECRYRQDLTDHIETWEKLNTRIYAITEDIDYPDGSQKNALIGIVTFHVFENTPTLYHCYIHPFFRKQGYLKRIWKEVLRTYPEFEVEKPISHSLTCFLEKYAKVEYNGALMVVTGNAIMKGGL